jgi:hypothetical protein
MLDTTQSAINCIYNSLAECEDVPNRVVIILTKDGIVIPTTDIGNRSTVRLAHWGAEELHFDDFLEATGLEPSDFGSVSVYCDFADIMMISGLKSDILSELEELVTANEEDEIVG